MPTISVDLPSKGLLYAEDNPLSSGKIELKYMTAVEEDILTNDNYIKNGVVVEKLMQSMITDKIDFNTLLIGDKDQIMVACRILGFGKDYRIKYQGDNDKTNRSYTIDLTQIKDKEINWEIIEKAKRRNEFEFVLPISKLPITFKLLTHGDEKKIAQEIKGLAKNTNVEKNVSTRLKFMITSVNGNREVAHIRDFVDNGLITLDSKPLDKYISTISPGLNFDVNAVADDNGEVLEGLSLPMTVEFFWPRP